MYSAKILADSVSAHGHRLTTMEVVLPRFLLPELNTHRMFSRNSRSSRAVPPEKVLSEVTSEPFVPEFNLRVTGMGVGEALEPEAAFWAREAWLGSRNAAVKAARALIRLGVDKSRVNRLLEPFAWHTVLITATDWSNFFALRTDPSAQPEFRKVALMMKEVYDSNDTWACPDACWHLPLIGLEEMSLPIDYYYWKMVSVGRCARVSYLTHDGVRSPEKDVGLHNHLWDSGHLSPFEHVARPLHDAEWLVIRETQEELRLFHGKAWPQQVETWCRQLEYDGNFHGWKQYRSEVPAQHDFSLVKAA